jgi:hypothetical protein
MPVHRIRLDDAEVDLITAALRARLAALRGPRRQTIERLLERLEDGGVGNPRWRFEGHSTLHVRENPPQT